MKFDCVDGFPRVPQSRTSCQIGNCSFRTHASTPSFPLHPLAVFAFHPGISFSSPALLRGGIRPPFLYNTSSFLLTPELGLDAGCPEGLANPHNLSVSCDKFILVDSHLIIRNHCYFLNLSLPFTIDKNME